ncbi:MAG: hypothetical protein ACJ75B_10745 [Flavisolibacter sp.]
MKRIRILVLASVLIISCILSGGRRCRITILNNTQVLLDSVKVDTYNFDHVFRNVEPHKSAGTDFKVSLAGDQEGVFRLRVYVKDSEKIAKTFGYFEGSGDIKPNYTIEIKNDFKTQETNRGIGY